MAEAIAEVEQNKSEAAVMSTDYNILNNVFDSSNKFTNDDCPSSSANISKGTFKKYCLFDNIKAFRFDMPEGWNDEHFGVFVECCWEKIDDFYSSEIDRLEIWSAVAQSAAKKSKNQTLFTINSCLELAERIRDYVSTNMSCLLNNSQFMDFYNDVEELLPFFSDKCEPNGLTENNSNEDNIINKKSVTEQKTSEIDKNRSFGVADKEIKDNENASKITDFRGFYSNNEYTTKVNNKLGMLKLILRNVYDANTDTKTNEHLSSSCNNVPRRKRVNIKRKCNVTKKEDTAKRNSSRTKFKKVMDCDIRIKPCFVKLVDIRKIASGSNLPWDMTIIQEKSPLPSRIRQKSKEVSLEVKTDTMVNDVLNSRYKLRTDPPRLLTCEHLTTYQQSGLRKETEQNLNLTTATLPTSSKCSKDLDFLSRMSESESSLYTGRYVNSISELPKCTTTVTAASVSRFHENDTLMEKRDSLDDRTSPQPSTSSGIMRTDSLNERSDNLGDRTSPLPPNSSGIFNANKSAFATALAASQSCCKQYMSQPNSTLSNSSSNLVPNHVLAEPRNANQPRWFADFINDLKSHEQWKIEKLASMKDSIAEVEYRTVALLEQIFKALLDNENK